MNKLVKFYQTDTQKIFFTSDPHLHHKQPFIWQKRGYNNSNEHVEGIITKINEVVRDTDILFILGDITLNCTEAEFDIILDQINCKNIKMIWGNHNNPSYLFYKKQQELQYHISSEHTEIYPVKYKNLQFLGNYQEIVVDGQYIVLCHYPIHSWNWRSKGSWMCAGHEHGDFYPTLPTTLDCGKILDVGWDIFKKPLSMSEIKIIMDTKPVSGAGHHTS